MATAGFRNGIAKLIKKKNKSWDGFRSRELILVCFFFIIDSIIIINEGPKILIVLITKWKECVGGREAIPWLITTL